MKHEVRLTSMAPLAPTEVDCSPLELRILAALQQMEENHSYQDLFLVCPPSAEAFYRKHFPGTRIVVSRPIPLQGNGK